MVALWASLAACPATARAQGADAQAQANAQAQAYRDANPPTTQGPTFDDRQSMGIASDYRIGPYVPFQTLDSLKPPAGCRAPKKANPKEPPPKVVSAFPAKGAVVRPGVLVVRITFDRPMVCGATFKTDAALVNPCSEDPRAVVLSFDRKTFRTVCQVEAGQRYDLPVQDFTSLGGHEAEAYTLSFTASKEAPAATVREALAEDGPAKTDVPEPKALARR